MKYELATYGSCDVYERATYGSCDVYERVTYDFNYGYEKRCMVPVMPMKGRPIVPVHMKGRSIGSSDELLFI